MLLTSKKRPSSGSQLWKAKAHPQKPTPLHACPTTGHSDHDSDPTTPATHRPRLRLCVGTLTLMLDPKRSAPSPARHPSLLLPLTPHLSSSPSILVLYPHPAHPPHPHPAICNSSQSLPLTCNISHPTSSHDQHPFTPNQPTYLESPRRVTLRILATAASKREKTKPVS
jgi:hypothetical protein